MLFIKVLFLGTAQPAFISSNSTMETAEQCVKYVQS